MKIVVAQAVALLVLAGGDALAAEIYRCTDGRAVTYQQVPCERDGAATRLPASFPEVNREARERLLQREAALDARLLKRAEIEAAERIARDERLGRERLAEAIVEAERIRAQSTPILVVHRGVRHAPRAAWRGAGRYRPY